MVANTAAQAELNAALVSRDAQQVIDLARQHGAIGWKVNGAGGEGGSITLLCGDTSSQKRELIRQIEAANPLFKNIPIYLSRFGLRTWNAHG
jgi:D-glycero-alpha-D-manno-heptose-7-phosphate kinase